MIVEILVASLCVRTPECAVREIRPWGDKVLCQRSGKRQWNCIVAMRNGHAFRYRVERHYEPVNGVEYVGGWMKVLPR